jgi:hypothetical protein
VCVCVLFRLMYLTHTLIHTHNARAPSIRTYKTRTHIHLLPEYPIPLLVPLPNSSCPTYRWRQILWKRRTVWLHNCWTPFNRSGHLKSLTCVRVCMRACMFLCVLVHAFECVYVCVRVNVCVYTHLQAGKQPYKLMLYFWRSPNTHPELHT